MFFFFFKQKTAYEMRISDWSSDVCSSDLILRMNGDTPLPRGQNTRQRRILGHQKIAGRGAHEDLDPRRARQAFQFRKLLRIRGGRADIEGMIAPHAMMAAPDFVLQPLRAISVGAGDRKSTRLNSSH